MTEIINGEIRYNELTKNANGGTELMARRMVEYISPAALEGFQIIHSRVRNLEPNLKRILVCHDLPFDPEYEKMRDPRYLDNFDKIVFVSYWQQNMFCSLYNIPYYKTTVIRNGIDFNYIIPDSISRYEVNRPIKLIYHTTPHRGLNILVPVFIELAKKHNITLDVFSSFNAYGWGERDSHYRELFDIIDNHPKMINHGYKPHDEVMEALADSDIFAYPNIWQETSCLSLIEAVSSGVICLHSGLAALPETSCGQTAMYSYNDDLNLHANLFYNELDILLDWYSKKSHVELSTIRNEQAKTMMDNYNILSIAKVWEKMLIDLQK